MNAQDRAQALWTAARRDRAAVRAPSTWRPGHTRLLLALGVDRTLSDVELARRCKLPLEPVRLWLRELRALNFAYQNPQTGRWRITPLGREVAAQLFELMKNARARVDRRRGPGPAREFWITTAGRHALGDTSSNETYTPRRKREQGVWVLTEAGREALRRAELSDQPNSVSA